MVSSAVLSAVSIDIEGMDGMVGGVGWDGEEWVGWGGRWQKSLFGTPHEQP